MSHIDTLGRMDLCILGMVLCSQWVRVLQASLERDMVVEFKQKCKKKKKTKFYEHWFIEKEYITYLLINESYMVQSDIVHFIKQKLWIWIPLMCSLNLELYLSAL